MAHKGRYNPPARKKKSHAPQTAPAAVAAVAPAAAPRAAVAAPAAAPFKLNRPAPAEVPASVRYAQLPAELRWLGMLTVLTIALLLILWLILK